MNRMVIANLLHRPLRSLISIVAVAVEVVLILLMVGLSLGILEDSKSRTKGIGADIMVRPPGSSFFSGITGAPVSIKVADLIRKQPHVSAVAPVITQLTTAGNVEVIYGVDLDPSSPNSFEAMSGPFRFLAGGLPAAPYELLVDDYFAAANHVTPGSTVNVLNTDFKVAGIVEHGKGARRFIPIQTLQELIGAQNKASVFYVKLDDPKSADAVAAGLKKIRGMEQFQVQSIQQWLSMMTMGNIPGLSQFITVVIAVAVIIGFIVIFQAMYTAVMERTREIGILKSMGASKAYVVNVILRETLLLSALGIVLGIALSFVARQGIVQRFPTLRVIVPTDWIGWATLIALLGAILGAIYPAFKAAQKDPIDALAYE